MTSGVQTAKVSADEAGMRVDRFFEARFPGLSFSHIQRVIRKGEVRVNGKRTEPKNRLEAGQTVRVPPLRLELILGNEPRPSTHSASSAVVRPRSPARPSRRAAARNALRHA